jgi:hypothetical protein
MEKLDTQCFFADMDPGIGKLMFCSIVGGALMELTIGGTFQTFDIFISGNFRKMFYLFLLLVLMSYQWLYTHQQAKFDGLLVDVEKIWSDRKPNGTIKGPKHFKILSSRHQNH